MLKILGLAAIVAIASGCVSPTAGSTTQNLTNDNDNAKAAKAAAKEQVASVIQCRYIVQTGTRFGTRICMKKTDWQARDKTTSEGARDEMDRLSRAADHTQNMRGLEGQ